MLEAGMKIVVVGAGISGCIAALAAAEAGHEVTILENASHPGGVLRDHETANGVYYRNCQYINVNTPWSDMLLSLTGLACEIFPHNYGSWCDLFEEEVVHDNFAQVVVPKLNAKPIEGSSSFKSASDRLGRYQEPIASKLQKWASKWGNLDLLDHNNLQFMQLSRIFYRDDLQGVLSAKRTCLLSDELYGVPRNQLQPPISVQHAALPKGGWNRAFDVIRQALDIRNVKILFRSTAKAFNQEGKIQAGIGRDIMSSDLVVWCANPNPLLLAIDNERLDSPKTQMINILMEVDGHLPSTPIYWQIFSQTSPIVRLFCYRLTGRLCITIEAFDSDANVSELASQAMHFANHLGLDVTPRSITSVPDQRFVLVTLMDSMRFACLEIIANSAGLVTGGWHLYGRDQRLAHILERMKKMGAL